MNLAQALQATRTNIERIERAARRLPEPLRSEGIATAGALRAASAGATSNVSQAGLGLAPVVWAALVGGTALFAGGGAIGAWVRDLFGHSQSVAERLECIDERMTRDPALTTEEAGRLCTPPPVVPPWVWGLGIGTLALVAFAAMRR